MKPKLLISLLLTAGLQAASIRAIFKYIPFQPVAFLLVLVVSVAAYYFILDLQSDKPGLFKQPVITALIVVFIAIANFIAYPKADALKASGRGSDADDAIIIATTKLFHGQHPYSEPTYLGNQISPGPGVLLAYAPFVLTGTYFLAMPFFVCLFAWLLRQLTGAWTFANLGLIFLISSLGFWEYMVIGSDLFAIGCLLLLVFVLAMKYQNQLAPTLLVAVVAGIVLTSRIHLVYFAPVIAFILFKNNIRAGILFGLTAIIVCLGIHFAFYSWNPNEYAPMHLITKGQNSMPRILLLLAAVVNVALLIIFMTRKKLPQQIALKYAWLFIAVPHLFIGLARTISDGYQLHMSEGPGYLVIQIALLIGYCMVKWETVAWAK